MPSARSCLASLLFLLSSNSGLEAAEDARSQTGATASAVSLTSSPNPATYGQSVSLTAAVTPGASGKVTFYDGIAVIGVSTVIAGTASLSTITLASGSRRLAAYYGGDSTYRASTSSWI